MSYRPLLWLAVATFSTGIDGYVLAGLLPAIAGDLHVSEALAGQLMSAFALTSALAAPLLGTVTSRWEQRSTIALSLGVFVLGNLIVGIAPSYPIALGGRVVAALGGCLLTVILTALLVNSLFGVLASTFGVLGVAGLVWFFAAGIGNGGAAVPQQARLAALAPDSAPIVMALNGSAISLGAALGSALGGASLAAGSSPYGLLTVAAIILAITLALHQVVAKPS